MRPLDLKTIRAWKGKTQFDIGIATKLSPSTISLIERGYRPASLYEKSHIAKALGVSVSEIDWREVPRARAV
jgi:transcriptional regulator with XRE-family HTH domain